MKRIFLWILGLGALFVLPCSVWADETITVSATSSDISENLDLKTVAMLFGQAKDLEQFEQMLNNPDSAFSNLDLNGDGEVDYLRVIESADNNRHLVIIQAVLAQDIYQDVASIFVEKDENNQVTVQVIGDEYIYGANYIVEPVYIYRPMIYDWFWGSAWVCWHSPYYWGHWPSWWHPYYCVDPFIYWDHCYWHHYHHPICSYRTGHHYHPHYRPMREPVRRNDFARRHPERSFATRNVSRNITNARALEQNRRVTMQQAVNNGRVNVSANATRVSASSVRSNGQTVRNATYGSANLRQVAAPVSRATTVTRASSVANVTHSSVAKPSTAVATRTSVSTRNMSNPSAIRRTSTVRREAQPVSVKATTATRTATAAAVRPASTNASPTRTSSTVRTSNNTMRSSTSTMRSSSSTIRSSSAVSGSTMRPAGTTTRSSNVRR